MNAALVSRHKQALLARDTALLVHAAATKEGKTLVSMMTDCVKLLRNERDCKIKEQSKKPQTRAEGLFFAG